MSLAPRKMQISLVKRANQQNNNRNAGECAEEKILEAMGRDVNQYRHHKEQYRGQKKMKIIYHVIQQSHSWVCTERKRSLIVKRSLHVHAYCRLLIIPERGMKTRLSRLIYAYLRQRTLRLSRLIYSYLREYQIQDLDFPDQDSCRSNLCYMPSR